MLGWKAKDAFHAYLAELSDTGQGIFLSQEARASIHQHLNWNTLGGDPFANQTINSALKAISKIQTAHVTRSLFICAHAGFEQFIRELQMAAATTISVNKIKRESLSEKDKVTIEKLVGHQIQLAGDSFRRYFEPLAHLQINYATVASAVVQSSQASHPILLDGTVFGFRVGNIDRDELDSIFKRFSCSIPWDKFAENSELKKIFKTTRKSDTDKAITEFLNKALEMRNKIAHTQGSVHIPKEELELQIRFLIEISTFLHQTLTDSINALLP